MLKYISYPAIEIMIQYKINKGFIVQKIGKKIAIFNGEESLLYTLNDSSSLIYQKIKSGIEINKIISSFVRIYRISEKKAVKDINDSIKDMESKKIIIAVK